MTPKISLIIPCYNQEEYIERCLKSVIKQSFQNWEAILVDDGSTDNTAEILLNFCKTDHRFHYHLKTNGGLSSARNSGLQMASGEYLFFLDSDDTLSNNDVLQNLINAADSETEIVFGNVNNEFEDGKIVPAKFSEKLHSITVFNGEEVFKAYLEEKIPAVVWNKLYLTSFVKKNQFEFVPKLLHEDELWSLQVFMKANKVKYIPEEVVNYYKGNASSITASVTDKNIDSLIYIMKQIAHLSETHEKFKKTDKKLIVRLFEKHYYFLKNPNIIANQKLWKVKYQEIRKIYRKSVLNNYQKRFVYDANISYFALKMIQKKPKSFLNKVLTKFITF